MQRCYMTRFRGSCSAQPTDLHQLQGPMNRLAKYDQNVFSIADLQREGTKKLSKMVGEYYNEGAMDLLSYVQPSLL